MKILCFLAALLAAWISQPALAQTSTAAAPRVVVSKPSVDFSAELMAITQELNKQFSAGKTNAAEMQASLTNVNALITKYSKNGQREQVARLYLLEAHIYADALHDRARAKAIWQQVVRDFPHTLSAQMANVSLVAPTTETSGGLEVGQPLPDFSALDVSGKAISISGLRGHVTMVDFWATWCGPCRAEMPNVIATYQKYHGQGFEILGVSLDQDRDQLVNFTRSQGMAWPQYFDGMGWKNELAQKYEIDGIPMSFLLNRQGIIIGKGLRGAALGEAVAKALAAK